MIEYRTGDILQADVEALVNTVNCVGVMGRGIALQFRNAYPENFRAYAAACAKREVQPGRMFVHSTGKLMNPRLIVNFPTKRHWREKSSMADIESGLAALARTVREYGLGSIAVPPLGCGLGGLRWEAVRPRIEAAMRALPHVRVLVYEPAGAPASATMAHGATPKMTPGRAALIGLLRRYLDGLLDPFVTLLEAHKLLYFMQVAGEPLRLEFRQGLYGPYADNLRHVLHQMEGHYIVGYGDGGDMPGKRLRLLPDAVRIAEESLRHCPETRQHFERVADLTTGFESPFGLELLASVHWVIDRLQALRPEDVVAHVHGWNRRKRQFSKRQILLARDTLAEKSWV